MMTWKHTRRAKRRLFALTCGLILIWTSDSLATLGQPTNSVAGADATALNATIRPDEIRPNSKGTGSLTCHRIVYGRASVCEYSNAGSIYAITWHGHGHPDLAHLLGQHYAEFTQALQQTASNFRTRTSVLRTPNLWIRLIGVPRAMSGSICLIKNLPSGVSCQELPQ